jgi:hypothetical protein
MATAARAMATIHFCLPLEAHSWWPCISPTDSDDINKLAFPIEYHPFLVDLERGAVRWQVDEMMPSQKRFPLVCNNHKFPALVARQVCSSKKCLVVVLLHAKSFGQMECVVEAGIDAVPVRWRFRQQQEEFCYLVQSV